MSLACNELRFLWWNVQDFAHFDVTTASRPRWPDSRRAYESKLDRISSVMFELSRNEPPHLIALAETTFTALSDLKDRVFPNYNLHGLTEICGKEDFQVAILYAPQMGFESSSEDFVSVSNVPNSTRPMASIDFKSAGHRIRFYACHWPARFEEGSKRNRQLSALALNNSIYEFMRKSTELEVSRHAMVIGDLNEEPFGSPLRSWVYSSRDRARSQQPDHYSDRSIRRVRLYNCSWRLLGERKSHPFSGRHAAGSYYWKKRKSWHNFDQVLVSGSLLTESTPYIDESFTQILYDREAIPDSYLGRNGVPHKFEWNRGHPIGLSDHLPLGGRILLSAEMQ